MNLMNLRICLAATLLLTSSIAAYGDDPVFSGPQVGEKLVPFKVIAVGGADNGKEIDPIERAEGKPTMLVFVHKLTRPGISLARGLTAYAVDQKGVATGIIWLDDDKAAAEAYLNRAMKSLNFKAPLGISVDGGEGPGAYGLNRNVELTILVANKNSITANFALVQPSVTEGVKIASELAKLIEKPAPTSEQLAKYVNPRNPAMRGNMQRQRRAGDLRSLMRSLIDADDEKIGEAAKEIEKWIGNDKAKRAQVKRMSSMVLERGLGSEKVQAQLKKWQGAKEEDNDQAERE